MAKLLLYIAATLCLIGSDYAVGGQTSNSLTTQAREPLPTVAKSDYKDFDIIFHTSESNQSLAVQQATKSIYSHMGIIIFRKEKPYVFEAVSPVKFTLLSDWKARGKKGKYVIKRLKNHDTLLTTETRATVSEFIQDFENKPYDLTFEWSDERLYCSELVWKLYDRAFNIQLAPLARLEDFNLTSPPVKAKLKERYGYNIPYKEKVISPQAIFDSTLLYTVESKF